MEPAAEFSLSFLAPERVAESMATVLEFTRSLGTATGEPLNFWDAMRTVQSADLPARQPAVELHWYEGPDDTFEGALNSLMGGISARQEATPYSNEERDAISRSFELALQLFRSRFPQTFSSFARLTSFVVLARRSGYSGGTVSNRIGLIWLAPEADWTTETWLENLVHEFVHNALFLEDMVHSVLVAGGDRLEQPDALAISAIRQVKRGYDKSYHSGFVSLTIIEMYRALGLAANGQPFIAPLMVCVEDLVKQREFATAQGQALLDELVEAVLAVWETASRRIDVGVGQPEPPRQMKVRVTGLA